MYYIIRIPVFLSLFKEYSQTGVQTPTLSFGQVASILQAFLIQYLRAYNMPGTILAVGTSRYKTDITSALKERYFS